MQSLLSCFVTGCLLLAVLNAGAQSGSTATTAQNASPRQNDLAAEPFVVRQWHSVYSYNPDGTGYREQTFVVAVQSEAALRAFGVLAVPFAGASEKAQFLYARVRHADSSVVETPTDASFEEPAPVTREAPLYSDLRQRELPIKSLRVGDTLEWQFRVERTKSEAPGEFWGRQEWTTGAVTLAETIELRVPSNRRITVWTNPETRLDPSVSVEGTQKIYRWSTSALDPTVGSQAEAARKAKEKAVLTPAQQQDATLGKLPDVAWTSFPSWQAVGAWYRSLETGRTSPTPAIVAKVNELTAGKATLDDKLHAVYAYVSGQIHYIGVDLGIGRYQPHPATEILDNQYGDCKDKHTLLAAMLQVLGVQADAVLIGGGVRFNNDVPAPDTFNHVITHFAVGSEEVWLDATAEVAPYRMLFASLRDKDALVVSPTSARISRTPVDPPFPTFEKMEAVGTLDKDGNADTHTTYTLRGDEELLVRSVLRQITPAQYDEVTQKMVANLGFGGTVTHARFAHIDDPSQPLAVEWDYHREKPGNDWDNLRITPSVMMTLLPVVDEKDPPVSDVPLLGARDITSTSKITLPSGWSAELPEAVHATSAFGTYDLTFRYDNGTVYATRHWTVTKDKIPQADWKAYKKWTDAIALGTEPYVQLRRGDATSPSNTSRATSSMSPDLAEVYIDQALTALRQNHLDQGQALLDKAKAISPAHAALTGDYGYLAWRRGNYPEAIRLYRKELEAHPDSFWVYRDLSRLQFDTGDTDAAIETLRRFVDAAPANPDAAAALIAGLNSLHRQHDALSAANDSLNRLPSSAQSNSSLQAAVLQAQLRGGDKERGAATAVALLANTTDPRLMNNAAYDLAVAGTNMPLAESTIRTAIDQLTTESQAWTLDESLPQLLARSQLLTAAWDTLGYILLQQGHPEQAESYIKARWLVHPTAEAGEHLGDAESALHNTADAIHTYQLALATIPHYNALGVRSTTPSPDEDSLKNRLAQLKAPASGPGVPTAPEQLQGLRTIPLLSALKANGTAEYKFLLSAHGVQRVEPTSSKDLAGAVTSLQSLQIPSAFFPSGSSAQLVRVGMLNCHNNHCEVVFLP